MQKFYTLLTACILLICTVSCTHDPQLDSVGQAMKTNKAYFEDNASLLLQIRSLSYFMDNSYLAKNMAEKASQVVSNSALMKLTNQIVADHEAVQEKLMMIADSLNFVLPETMTREKYNQLADLNLEAKKNPEFDHYYIMAMKRNYTDMGKDLKSLSVANGHELIYDFAKSTKAALSKHVKAANNLDKAMAHHEDHSGHVGHGEVSHDDHEGHDHDNHEGHDH